jgi:hypothetical protein
MRILKVTLVFKNFNDYVEQYPQAESFRQWITNKNNNTCILIKSNDKYDFLFPGGYLWVSIVNYKKGPTVVKVNNADDCSIEKPTDNPNHDIEDLINLAPFKMSELRDFGYDYC